MGVEDRNGEEYSEITGEKVKIYVELPDGWNKDDLSALFLKSLSGESFGDSKKL